MSSKAAPASTSRTVHFTVRDQVYIVPRPEAPSPVHPYTHALPSAVSLPDRAVISCVQNSPEMTAMVISWERCGLQGLPTSEATTMRPISFFPRESPRACDLTAPSTNR
jgi:hypothetical protein